MVQDKQVRPGGIGLGVFFFLMYDIWFKSSPTYAKKKPPPSLHALVSRWRLVLLEDLGCVKISLISFLFYFFILFFRRWMPHFFFFFFFFLICVRKRIKNKEAPDKMMLDRAQTSFFAIPKNSTLAPHYMAWRCNHPRFKHVEFFCKSNPSLHIRWSILFFPHFHSLQQLNSFFFYV